MSWCPKCKYEYRKGIANCSDCGCELVEVLKFEKDEALEETIDIIENDTETLLISVSKDYEAKIIESKLNAFGVPTLKRFRGLDGIYGFANSTGIDIYVPFKLLDHAKEIISNEIS